MRFERPPVFMISPASMKNGTAMAAGRALRADDMTCRNWTSSESGAAMVGHHDRRGLRDDEPSKSWNTSHPSRGPNAQPGAGNSVSLVASSWHRGQPALHLADGAGRAERRRRRRGGGSGL